MRLIIIGDMSSPVIAASKIASDKGAKVVQCKDTNMALGRLRSGQGADMALIDVAMDVAGFISALKTERINITVVGYGCDNDSKSAVRAIKAGAREYIPFPPDKEIIAAVLETISDDSTSIIASSEPMKKVIAIAEQVAPSEAGVLITGESGTGKEVIAKHIHHTSKRSAKDMISVNCAAIPDNLLESELFGHEKGAFTGAIARRIGKFEEADGSTLLLDEISEMDIRLQAKLLRAIQEKEIDRVGGNKPVKVDIRIIATSNRDLFSEVKQGNFREDLYYRLNVIHLDLPPLRARNQDIVVFAENFIEKYATLNQTKKRKLSAKAIEKLKRHNWPGNVRELENTMHRAVLLASGEYIDEEAIILTQTGYESKESRGLTDNSSSTFESSAMVGRTVDSVERELIINTLEHCLGNRSKAANILGISIRTLRNKLALYEQQKELT